MPPDLVEVLADYKRYATCEWMFPSPVNKGAPRNPTAVYRRTQLILERARCKKVRFHDLRHTFATMALENGMDVKTLSDMIGHISAETTLNIYSHIADTMRVQATVKIDRKIGGCDTQMPTEDGMRTDTNPTAEIDTEEEFESYRGKIRKPGTGGISKLGDHLYEGRFTPTVGGKRVSKNIYAKTREECEEKLAELIRVTKAEIAEMKANASA